MHLEGTYNEILSWLGMRWEYVKQEGGFNELERWAVANISLSALMQISSQLLTLKYFIDIGVSEEKLLGTEV